MCFFFCKNKNPFSSSYYSAMDLTLIVVIFLLCFYSCTITLQARPLKHKTTTHITVAGVVYCDICSNNGFSSHSYFLPGVDVNVRCRFKTTSPRTSEKVTFSVNRTTDKYGVYKLEIPSVDGVNCVDGLSIESSCQASLSGTSPETSCDVPVLRTTLNEVSAKSKQDNVCLYSLNAMSYKPLEKNVTLCDSESHTQEMKVKMGNYLNESKFFIPYFPPYFWPPLPQFPFPNLPPIPYPFPNLPPMPYLPFPPLPPFSYFPFPPISFPFPPVPPLFAPPPPPAFALGDPRTWIPGFPPLSFSPPSPPPPSAFSLTDPRTWTPYLPPSPPASP